MVKNLMFESNAGEGGFQGLWNNLLSMFNSGKDEVVRSSKVSKARLDVSSLKKEKERVFVRLGEEVYKKHKEKSVTIPGLAPYFAEIEIIDARLASKEREIKELKGEAGSLFLTPEAGTDLKRMPRKRSLMHNEKATEVMQGVSG